MLRTITKSITLAVLLIYTVELSGCAKIVHVPAHETKAGKTTLGTGKAIRSIVAVHTEDRVVIFARPVGIDTSSNTVSGYTPANEFVSVPLEDVISFDVKQTSGEPLLWVTGAYLTVAIVSALIGAAVDK